MQVLHNGSAPASQAGCVGSIPITCSKKDIAEKLGDVFFGIPRENRGILLI